jgi:beta-phosphoglucomutase-like phosphatase (HAD superfamily)
MLKYILWDIDGVFVDTEALHLKAWQHLVEQFGKTLTIEEYRGMAGRGSQENMKEICTLKDIPYDFESLNKIRRDYYESLRDAGIPVIQENVVFARELQKVFPDIVPVAVSSAAQKDIQENIKTAGLEGFFRKVFSFEDHPDIKRKPAPDIYLYALKDLGVAAEECLAFEDSSNGLIAAKDAGIRCIALPNDITLAQDFSRADLVIPSDERTIVSINNLFNG